jgi:hypothetical protein
MAILRPDGWAGAALVCGVLSGCASTNYVNTMHPEYGTAQHDTDLTQCRQQHSQVIQHAGYADAAEVKVDEPAVQTCMATLGWQPAKP